MNKFEEPIKAAFLSTYPPRECGIATFTQDLIRALKETKRVDAHVVAVSDNRYHYDQDVLFELKQYDRKNYKTAAEKINKAGLDLLVIEHEYGIFGGDNGEYLLDLLDNIQIPIVSTFHTVLPFPSNKQKDILAALCRRSSRVVTMAHCTQKLLEQIYGADPQKVCSIHHGVPEFEFSPRPEVKESMGLENKTIISTFGLISPGKGLEYGIEAIGRLVPEHPDILYLILGQTHPTVKKQAGEAYRLRLKELIRKLHLQNHVRFINRYLSKKEIALYLNASDIYLTPYLDRNQAVSGTLAYATGYGRAVVSTPYPYAKEILNKGSGLLAEFENAGSLAECMEDLLSHEEKRKQMEQRALLLGREMLWSNVARRYADTFGTTVKEYAAAAGRRTA